MTYYEVAGRARALLVDAGILPETATLDADLLARHALDWDLATWLARRGEQADPKFVERYEALIKRRVTREPIAYIRRFQEFWGREFLVSPAVLIPRPETELLIEHASKFLHRHQHARVVDVGTGSGCIAITLALEHPDATVHAIDISPAALEIARTNASRLGATRIHFVLGSLLEAAPRPIDLLVSNPPYVAERDKPGLSREVRDYEPPVALFGGDDGWREIRGLLRSAADALAPDGIFLMEVGYGQSEGLEAELSAVKDLHLSELAADLQGIQRLAVIRRG